MGPKTNRKKKRNIEPMAILVIGTFSLCISGCSKNMTVPSGAANATSQNKEGSIESDHYYKYDALTAVPDRNLDKFVKLYSTRRHKLYSSRDFSQAARTAIESEDWVGAETLATEAIRREKTNAEAFYVRGRARCSLLDVADKVALSDLNKAEKMGISEPELFRCKAKIYDSRGEPKKAIKVLTKAIERNPDEDSLYKLRAALYNDLGMKDEAAFDYDKAVELSPTPLAYMMRGLFLESIGKNDQAISDYDQASLKPYKSYKKDLRQIATKAKGELLYKIGRHKEALSTVDQMISVDETDAEAWKLRGKIHGAMSLYPDAIEDYGKVIEIEPTYAATAYEERSSIYEKLGMKVKANEDKKMAATIRSAPAIKDLYSEN